MAENVPVSATKARWAGAAGALICLVLFYAGPYIGLPVPEIEDVTDAFVRLGVAGATYLGTYGMTWISPANRPKPDQPPMGGGLQAPWWSVLGAAGLALLLMGGMAGCTVDPKTGTVRADMVAVVQGLSLAGSVLALATGDEDDPPPDVIALAANGVEDGIAKFCRLDPWDQDTVRRQLDARDPSLRPYLIARYGGPDGDVCTGDLVELPPPDG